MKFIHCPSHGDVSGVVRILNESHGTVAKEFGFTKETNPSNSAFIDEQTLRLQLGKGIELFQAVVNDNAIGCIAIEKSATEIGTFYIEKVSVLPEFRHRGYGRSMMEFATEKIKACGGTCISIAVIDSHAVLKHWYAQQGFTETGTKNFPQLPFRVCFMKKEV